MRDCVCVHCMGSVACVWSLPPVFAVAFDVAGMAGGEPAGFGYWIGVLVGSAGLDVKKEVPKEMRNVFRRLARFLVANNFDHADQLRGGARAFVYSLGWVSVFSGRF